MAWYPEGVRGIAWVFLAVGLGAGCGHATFDRVVIEMDETSKEAVLDAVMNPWDLSPAERVRQIRPSYIGARWRL